MPNPLPPSDAEVYARQLFEKCHGYPLWRPEPYGSSPAYLCKGISVGDVGYVTRSGGFETLFNICFGADHPANYNGVPPNFEPLVIPEARIDKAPFHHQRNSRIVNGKNVGRSIGLGAGATDPVSQLLGAGADVQYTWRTAEGAILHLPNGAMRFECPPGLFHKYIKRHAQDWDTFINDTLQCNLPPGSIYLVTACDKTDEWMLGSFHQESTSREISLQISTLNLIQGRLSFSYHWDRTSPLVCRDHVRRLEADSMAVDPPPPDAGTHCVFLQGFRITVRKKKMSKKRQIEVEPIEEGSPQEVRKRQQRSLFSRSMSSSTLSWTVEPTSSTSGTNEKEEGPVVSSPSSTSSGESVIIEDMYGTPTDWHPSVQWNDRLLDMFPDADVAYTHDTDIPQLNNMAQDQPEGNPKEAVYDAGAAYWSWSEKPTISRPTRACTLCRKIRCHPDLPACKECVSRGNADRCSYKSPSDKSTSVSRTRLIRFRACDQCRRKKIKCDRHTSGCGQCERLKDECSFEVPAPSTSTSQATTSLLHETKPSSSGHSAVNENQKPSESLRQGGTTDKCSWCRTADILCSGDGTKCQTCELLDIECDRPAPPSGTTNATSAPYFMDFSELSAENPYLNSMYTYPLDYTLPGTTSPISTFAPMPTSPPPFEDYGELAQWKSTSRNASDASLNSIENLGEGSSSRMSLRYNPIPSPASRPTTRTRRERAAESEDEDDFAVHPDEVVTSRIESARAQRIEAEDRRRTELRDGYVRLKGVLPPVNERTTKPGLLSRAIQYIRSASSRNSALREQLEEQEREVARLREVNEALMLSLLQSPTEG